MVKTLLAGMGALAAALFAQAPANSSTAPLQFEVASIKPAPPLDPAKIMAGTLHLGISIDKARVDIGNSSLADLIRYAYSVKPYQVSGPDWMKSRRFDVLAKMPEGASKEQVPEMMQALLAERFKLTVHRDSKEQSVYALVVGKNGTNLKEAEPDPVPAADAPAKPGSMVFGTGDGQMRVTPNSDGKGASVAGGPFGHMKVSMGEAGMVRMEFGQLSMQNMADMLTRYTDRPVLDMTGLKGNYQVTLDLSVDEMRNVARAAAMQAGIPLPERPGGGGEPMKSPADSASTPSGTSLFAAIQKLGLKMDARKMPVESIVVDHMEKDPTEN